MSSNRGSDNRYVAGYSAAGSGGPGSIGDLSFGNAFGSGGYDALFNTNHAYEAILRSVGDTSTLAANVDPSTAATLGATIADYASYATQQQQRSDLATNSSSRGKGGRSRSSSKKDSSENRPSVTTDGEALVAAALEDYYKDERNVEVVDDEEEAVEGDDEENERENENDLEEINAQDDYDSDQESVDEAMSRKKRVRRTTPGSCRVKKVGYPFKYFITLEERFISKQTGKEHQRLCVCKYCQMEYEEYLKAFKQRKLPTCPTLPKRIVRAKRDLIQHLKKCPAFKKFRPAKDESEEELDEWYKKQQLARSSSKKKHSMTKKGVPVKRKKVAKHEDSDDEQSRFAESDEDAGQNYDDNEEEIDTESDYSAKAKKKRRRRSDGKSIVAPTDRKSASARLRSSNENFICMKVEKFPYSHFTTLDEKFVSKSTGKQNNQRLCICKYCSEEYKQLEKAYANKSVSIKPEPPKKFMRASRDLYRHLKQCAAYRQTCDDDYKLHFGSGVARVGMYDQVDDPVVTDIEKAVSKRLQQQQSKESMKRQLEIKRLALGHTTKDLEKKRQGLVTSSSKFASPSTIARKGARASTSDTVKTNVNVTAIRMVLLEFIIDNDIDATIVETQSFQRFLSTVLPNFNHAVHLPQTVSDVLNLLKVRGTVAEVALESALCEYFESSKGDKHRGGLIVRNFDFDRGSVATGSIGRGDDVCSNQTIFRISAGGSIFIMNPRKEIKPIRGDGGKEKTNAVNDADVDASGPTEIDPDCSEIESNNKVEGEAVDDVSSEHDVIAVARSWEHILLQNRDKYRLSYLVANESKWFPEVRRILGLRHPHIIFNRCWAHQILIIMTKSLLAMPSDGGSTRNNTGGHFVETFQSASDIVRTINGSTKWFSMFQTEARAMYGKNCSVDLVDNNIYTAAIFDQNAQWWYTTHNCVSSLLRVKGAAQSFSSKYETHHDFPAAFFALNDDDFWWKAAKAEIFLRPFCDVVNILHQKGNTMAHVMFMLLYLTRHFLLDSDKKIDNMDDDVAGGENEARAELLHDLECRWKREENPIFFLAFALHPLFRDTAVQILKSSYETDGGWMTHQNALSIPRLVKAGKFYYEKYRLKTTTDPLKVDEEMKVFAKLLWQWLSGKDFDVSVSIPNENAVDWWDENKMELKYLSEFAKFLLDAPVQTTTCEDLFQGIDYSDRHHNYGGMQHDEYNRKVAAIKEHMNMVYSTTNSKSGDSWNAVVSSLEYVRQEIDSFGVDATKSDVDNVESREGKEHFAARSNFRKIDGIDEMDCWSMLYNRVVPENDTEDYFLEEEDVEQDVDKTKSADVDDDHAGNASEDDDQYEVQPDPLPPLLDVKQAKYPQENRQYFKRKKYVRNDKYELQKMIFSEIKLPSLSCFMINDV